MKFLVLEPALRHSLFQLAMIECVIRGAVVVTLYEGASITHIV